MTQLGDGPAVLVVTALEDATADLVISALNRRRVPVVRVDPAGLDATTSSATSGRLTFAARIGGDRAQWAGSLSTGSRDLDLGRVRSVYHRRPGPWRFGHLPRQARDFAVREARHGFGGLLAHLPALHVNAPAATARAEYKPAQLQVAAEVGFTVPATLITNDLTAARRFIGEHGAVVYKTFRGLPPADGRTGAIWTQRVEAGELDESLAVTAHLFQAEVAGKTADVRVTVIGRGPGAVFAWRIEAPGAPLDWRSGDRDRLEYSRYEPPGDVERRLFEYLDRFGLVFGCSDFAVDASGRLVWIECNPNGQWGFLPDYERQADAFAAVLQAGGPRGDLGE